MARLRSPQGKLLNPSRRRACIEQVRRELPVSERRACAMLGQHRSTQCKAPRGANRRGPADGRRHRVGARLRPLRLSAHYGPAERGGLRCETPRVVNVLHVVPINTQLRTTRWASRSGVHCRKRRRTLAVPFSTNACALSVWCRMRKPARRAAPRSDSAISSTVGLGPDRSSGLPM